MYCAELEYPLTTCIFSIQGFVNSRLMSPGIVDLDLYYQHPRPHLFIVDVMAIVHRYGDCFNSYVTSVCDCMRGRQVNRP
ncbi:hypothetical protein ABKN59_004218 [Abortiporus biennis]